MRTKNILCVVAMATLLGAQPAGSHPTLHSPGPHRRDAPSTDPTTAALEAAHRQDRHDLGAATALARHHLALARRSGDDAHVERAEGVLAHWLDDPAPPNEILLLRATILQNRHAFDAALEDLDQLLQRDLRDARAWLTRATLLQARGEPEAARRSCLPLLAMSRPLLATTCIARADGVSGRASAAYAALEAVLSKFPGAEPGVRRFARVSLAEIASRLGRDADAETHYSAALVDADRDAVDLASHADFLLDAGRHQEVLALIPVDAVAGGLQLRRAIANRALGHRLAPHALDRLEHAYAGSDLHAGDHARLLLELRDRPDEALRRAMHNFSLQREPRDVRTLLEAAVAAGQPEAASAALRFVARTGLEDQRIEALRLALESTQAASLRP